VTTANVPREFVVLNKASQMLAQANSIDEIKTIRDKAEAARIYVKAARLGLGLQNRAAEVKLRAERKAGTYLKSLKLRGGDRKSKKYAAALKLKDLGITRDQSKRWQRIASISDDEFDKFLNDMNDQSREVTSAALLRIAFRRSLKTHARANGPQNQIIRLRRRNESPYESLAELMNHFSLLGNILRPLYEDNGHELKRAERRVVGRLIVEIGDLISQLQQIVAMKDL
jgi:hypothetical protein